MNFVGECPECRRISGKYETATLEWFRVQSQLGIAEHLRDANISAKIVGELALIGKRRQVLRDMSDRHIVKAHKSVVAKGG